MIPEDQKNITTKTDKGNVDDDDVIVISLEVTNKLNHNVTMTTDEDADDKVVIGTKSKSKRNNHDVLKTDDEDDDDKIVIGSEVNTKPNHDDTMGTEEMPATVDLKICYECVFINQGQGHYSVK